MSDQEKSDLDHQYPFVTRVYSKDTESVQMYRLFMKLPKHFEDPNKLSDKKPLDLIRKSQQPKKMSKSVLAKIITKNR